VVDTVNQRIRRTIISTGRTSTLAGSGSIGSNDGTGVGATFNEPKGIVVSPDGTNLFVSESRTCCSHIRQIVVATGVVTTLVSGGASGFNGPTGLATSRDGTSLYVADRNNHRVCVVIISTAAVSVLAGSGTSGYNDGTGIAAQFNEPSYVAASPDGTLLYVTDSANRRIRQIVLSTGVTTTLAGSGANGQADGIGTSATLGNYPNGLGISPDGTYLYFADTQNALIRQIAVSTGAVTTLAGTGTGGFADGFGTDASFSWPYSVTVSSLNSHVFVVEYNNHRVRAITLPFD